MNTTRKYTPFALLLALGFALLVTLVHAAKASLGPVGPSAAAIAPDDLAIATGAVGATLEQDYFRAPVAEHAAGRALPCRLQMHVFDKTRLAQWCH